MNFFFFFQCSVRGSNLWSFDCEPSTLLLEPLHGLAKSVGMVPHNFEKKNNCIELAANFVSYHHTGILKDNISQT